MIVADASAVASFVLPDELGHFADFARATCTSEDLHVPAHWPVELANVVWKARRRERVTDDEAARAARGAAALARTAVVHPPPAIDRLAAFATRFDLTAYDAAYLWLAETLGIALLTGDAKLRRVADGRGVPVLCP